MADDVIHGLRFYAMAYQRVKQLLRSCTKKGLLLLATSLYKDTPASSNILLIYLHFSNRIRTYRNYCKYYHSRRYFRQLKKIVGYIDFFKKNQDGFPDSSLINGRNAQGE